MSRPFKFFGKIYSAVMFIHGSLQIGHFIVSIIRGVIIVTVNIENGGRIEFEGQIKVISFQ